MALKCEVIFEFLNNYVISTIKKLFQKIILLQQRCNSNFPKVKVYTAVITCLVTELLESNLKGLYLKLLSCIHTQAPFLQDHGILCQLTQARFDLILYQENFTFSTRSNLAQERLLFSELLIQLKLHKNDNSSFLLLLLYHNTKNSHQNDNKPITVLYRPMHMF